jgi:hypothetical protein
MSTSIRFSGRFIASTIRGPVQPVESDLDLRLPNKPFGFTAETSGRKTASLGYWFASIFPPKHVALLRNQKAYPAPNPGLPDAESPLRGFDEGFHFASTTKPGSEKEDAERLGLGR